MKIMCPISNIEELARFAAYDIGEMYFGIDNKNLIVNNRRPDYRCNFSYDKEELEQLFKYAEDKNLKLYVAFNSLVNDENTSESIIEEMDYCIQHGVKRFIIADINLMLTCKKSFGSDIEIVLSTCMPVYNQYAIDFYRNLGIKRIVLPRHITLSKMEKLVQDNKDMEFEVLIKNARCINEDGLCGFEHSLGRFSSLMEGGCCQLNYTVKVHGADSFDDITNKIMIKRFECIRGDFINACGACYIKKLSEIGISSLKLVGREFTAERKTRDLKFLQDCINHTYLSDEDYKCYVKNNYFETYGRKCEPSQCYY